MLSLLNPADPRPLLPVIAVWGLITWKLEPLGLLALCLTGGAATLFNLVAKDSGIRPRADSGQMLKMARGMLLFSLGWSCVFFLLSLTGTTSLEQAAANTGTLALRLLTVATLGLCLASTASPRVLSLALGWYLRPIFGKRVWEAALALGLMIHFLPLALTTLNQSREAIRLRLPNCPIRKKIILVVSVTLRRLTQKSWEQAIAVVSRHLDRPEAWMLTAKPAIPAMFKAFLLCMASFALLYTDSLWSILLNRYSVLLQDIV